MGRTPAIGVPFTPAPVSAPAPVSVPVPVSAPPPARTRTLRLTGDYHDATRLQAELSPLLALSLAGDTIHVDLDGADYLDDGAARVLRRATLAAAQAGVILTLAATRPGPLRFSERHLLTVRPTR